ncbi:MAG: cystathionine beta-synthase [Melioribacteraceae bacterium]|nr:MAG: cystathionine beta-synthase [Melioribacteraceae bacterium]
MEYKNNILELIGNTPLVKLNKITKGLKPQVFAKLESQNPGGSVKDRIGLQMILDAENQGLLKPGGTVIEATSGNTGIGIALTAAYKGYRSVFVVTDKVSQEKINYLRALGSEVIITSNAHDHDHPEYYVNIARRLNEEIPDSFFAYQYSNPSNPEAHYLTTGPELWEQTGGKITHFVSGIGTGGTISGTGKYLKEKNSDIKIIGADPYGSIYKPLKDRGEMIKGTPYLIEGVGQDCLPENVDFDYIDEVINVTDAESIAAAKNLTKYESIFSGGSTGTNLHVALKVAENLTENDVLVFIVCDIGERYLSKIYNHDWLVEHGFLSLETATLRDLVFQKKNSGDGNFISANPEMKVSEVIDILHTHGLPQIPVLLEGRIFGCVKSTDLTHKILENQALLDEPIRNVMEDCFPVLSMDTPLQEVKTKLKNSTAVLVEENRRIVDLISRYDLIEFMSENK